MTRSKWKGPFLSNSILKNAFLEKTEIWSRNSVIPSFLIGKTVCVHNGKEFKRFIITREKVGYKFGDFSFTRKVFSKGKLIVKNK
jgi:small subunit ribosomal protein S19